MLSNPETMRAIMNPETMGAMVNMQRVRVSLAWACVTARDLAQFYYISESSADLRSASKDASSAGRAAAAELRGG